MNKTDQKKVYVHLSSDKADKLEEQADTIGLTIEHLCQEILFNWIQSRKPMDPSG